MKKALIETGLLLLSLAIFYVLQFLRTFIVFFLYGEGVSADKQYDKWLFILAVIQILAIVILYLKKVLYKTILSVTLSIVAVIALCWYIFQTSI
ncbi:hypothetical protein AAFN85_07765 [Mucilaginibacter sp. CAU 1740]|uniref:hypothetical protein n=1 Tax=Mucilaginibacter sp. CAU 1740 TaxID=3140365 RepID=UPI00325C106D